MNQVAAILDSVILYRYSLVLALASAAGICFFMACSRSAGIPSVRSAWAALLAVVLSLPLSRLIYWYGRPDSFASLYKALTSLTTEDFALAGCFSGCALSAFLAGGPGGRGRVLDCMSIAGCAAIALGRLGSFFTATDRGQVMTRLTGLPWAYPVANISGQLEYRFATFLFQAAFAAVLGLLLLIVFFQKKRRNGDVALLFLLAYSASQILLDSTRYDSLYLRSNGFVSLVQILCAVGLVTILVHFSVRAVKACGMRKSLILIWISLLALLGTAGYMEYYVQRHGREAAFSYSVMGSCLLCIVLLGLLLWSMGNRYTSE